MHKNNYCEDDETNKPVQFDNTAHVVELQSQWLDDFLLSNELI